MITGKEAFEAWLNGEDVFFVYNMEHTKIDADTPIDVFLTSHSFYKKPRTIIINGIEVPAPFEPKEDEKAWFLSDDHGNGYSFCDHADVAEYQFGAWRTEDEIKQVVAALRSVFKC